MRFAVLCCRGIVRPRDRAVATGTAVLLALMAWGGSPPARASAEEDAAADRPLNILFILADDVGREVLGCYGGESYATPRIDALARRGLRFTHAFTMPVCHPTRIAFLTGRYPSRFDAGWGTFPREEEDRTLARALQEAGYATAVAGKWQLTLLGDDTGHPHRLGFDEYCLYGWHEGGRYWEPHIRQNGELRDDVEDRYGPDVYVDFLTGFMERHRDGPFFAFYSMALCHAVTDDLDEPVAFAPGKDRYESYAEMVAAMDERVGRLVDSVERLGLGESTLILYTTDNGSPRSMIVDAEDGRLVREPVASRWRGREVRGGKGRLTDLGTRVPLIAVHEGAMEPAVVDDLVDVTDFLPTFVELAGGAVPDVALDGRSFAARLRGEGAGPRTWVRAEQGDRGWVRDRRYKLRDDGRLFDLEHDPGESTAIPEGEGGEEAAAARRKLEAALEEVR